ncbi:hypothetical protein TWF730_008468 [Orbilia blumenaviensis]|uniref:Uncharacterized protein n=1 Tax=Orbilia blumenaviensis TaxID=1796055 RepID=A0AAV9V2Q2_9PEZI
MAENSTSYYPVASLYATHPHVLTTIMYYCSPTTFDAFRYTCKAVYSMSLDPDLLEHHLRTIVNRQHEIIANKPAQYPYEVQHMDSKFDTLDNAHGNLWRLRGLILQEFLRMQSSWRIGEYKKVVVEIDVHSGQEEKGVKQNFTNGPNFDGTIQIFSGTVRGDTFAVTWGNTKKTHLHTYHFTNSRKYALAKLDGPQGTDIRHEFSPDGLYWRTTFSSRNVRKSTSSKFALKMDNRFSIKINEGLYKRDPGGRDENNYYYGLYLPTVMAELTATFLHVRFDEEYIRGYDNENGPVDLAYELNWDLKRSWRVPAMSLSNAPNVVLPDHSDETIKLFLGKSGECKTEGYAIGLDDSSHREWKVLEPRRLEDDVSRLGVWRDVFVEFERGQGATETKLAVVATVSKNLVNPDPSKRFLLTNSRAMNPEDWVTVRIPLVLPPLIGEDRHGKLVLATVAPAAYFRTLGMRDPDIPWADKGFMNYKWDSKKDTNSTDSEPLLIRTGAMIRRELVDAEIVTRIVGWTDNGAVWIWDVSEKHILDSGQSNILQGSQEAVRVTGKKLGYVKDVKGIFVTGDRLVQRITLFTHGREQKVHGVGAEETGENDSGITSLRQQDIMRKIEQAQAKKGPEYQEQFQNNKDDPNGDREQAEPLQPLAEDDPEDSLLRWRMINYTFGQPKGGGSVSYRLNDSGALEEA